MRPKQLNDSDNSVKKKKGVLGSELRGLTNRLDVANEERI